MRNSDEELLRRWRSGDMRAGEALFERYFDPLFRFFASKVPEVAEDLMQETLMACVKGKERFRFDATFKTYMFVVARRQLRGYLERTRRLGTDGLGDQSAVDLASDPSAATAFIVNRREEERLFLEALRQLPLDYQIAIELNTWEGLTGPELAAVLEIPEGTVRSRLRRARLQLEKKIEELTTSGPLLESTLTELDDWAANVRALIQLARAEPDASERD